MFPEGSKPTVSVVICTLNEAENLPHVLAGIPGWVDEVILVDGYSTDNTVESAKDLRPGIGILYQPGKGKGDALKYGIREASGDIIVTLDADGETPPEYIHRFIDPLLNGTDFAKGSRLAHRRPIRMPRYRWFGNKLLAVTFNSLNGTKYTDVCSGYNAFWRHVFLGVPVTYDSFQMEQQFLARAHKAGLAIAEVAYHCEGRIAGRSKTSGIKQGLIDWLVIVAERFHG